MMKALVVLLLGGVVHGQDLTLAEAARTAQQKHPSVKVAVARVEAAMARVEQAKSGLLPKVNFRESYQVSNNPVFVFSTLLTQRRFTEANFRIDALNRPEAVNNFQSVLMADQVLYDAGVAKRGIEAARLASQMSSEEKRGMETQLAAGAARLYLGVLLAGEGLRVAGEAVKAAEADKARAQSVRTAGMATDADVLSIEVHLAAMKEQVVQRKAELEIAWAALNEMMGAQLDEQRALGTKLLPLGMTLAAVTDYEAKAGKERADARQTQLGVQIAEKQAAQARAALYPRISLRGALEANRGQFVRQGGGNWFAGVNLEWNLFNGYADKHKIAEASHMTAATRAQAEQVSSGARVQIRKAYAEAAAATERIGLARAAVEQAEESLRITRNRYENGLATVTDLLRTQVAVMESQLRRLLAVHDQRVAAVMLELAAGGLNPDSEVLR